MNSFGLIGGIGPESTVKYYQSIIREFRKRTQSNEYPNFFISSINMTEMLAYVNARQFDKLIEFLLGAIIKLERSGVQFAALASNTPHIVFDELNAKSPISLISIVEETVKSLDTEGVRKAILFGTKSTMKSNFYHEKASSRNIDLLIPNDSQIDIINDIYFNELVFNKIKETSKSQLLSIATDIADEQRAQGIILGGTELSLILKQEDFSELKLFDTTEIHVNAIIDRVIN